MKAEILARLQEERAAQRPVVLLTRLSDGAQHLWPQQAVADALAEAALWLAEAAPLPSAFTARRAKV